MTQEIFTSGAPWFVLRKISNVLLSNGERRMATVNGLKPLTYSSLPGKIKYKGKNISGTVFCSVDGTYKFVGTGKNKNLLSDWS